MRFQAVASLAEIDAARAAPLVVGLTDDGDAKVRAQAAAALGDAGERRHADRLARARSTTPATCATRPRWRCRALGDRRALPSLVAALGTPDRALDAATALAALGDRRRRRGARGAVAGSRRASSAIRWSKCAPPRRWPSAGDARGRSTAQSGQAPPRRGARPRAIRAIGAGRCVRTRRVERARRLRRGCAEADAPID